MRALPILLLAVFICRTGFALDLKATDFGVQADGKTDDGPAIQKMIEKARAHDGEAIRLIFPKAKTIYASTGKERYLFPLQKTKNITLDGSGSTFLLHPNIRLVDLDFAQRPCSRT